MVQCHEASAVVRTRLRRDEVARGVATARAKRDAKQLAAAEALEQLLASHDGARRVAEGEETGDRRRVKRAAPPPRPRSVMDARIDYSRPLEKRFKFGGATSDSNGVELLVPQRQRWGLGYGPAEAWAQQNQVIAPLPQQAAFLGIARPPEAQQPGGGAYGAGGYGFVPQAQPGYGAPFGPPRYGGGW